MYIHKSQRYATIFTTFTDVHRYHVQCIYSFTVSGESWGVFMTKANRELIKITSNDYFTPFIERSSAPGGSSD